jgi:prohibitin 2
MADKLNEFAGKFGKGGAPKGLGVGIKLLAVAAAGAYGLKESMYTGNTTLS